MASPKKRVNPLFVALAVVLVAVVVAVGVVFFQLHSKISALQTGASFTFRYEITPNSPDKPPLLNILERVNASSGSISGQYAPGKLQLSFYQLNEDDSVKTSPFTRVYIDSEETLFDIGQLYTVLRQAVTDKLSIASVLLPEWSLGDYSCCGACARFFRTSTTSPGTRITDTRPTPTLKMSLTWNGT